MKNKSPVAVLALITLMFFFAAPQMFVIWAQEEGVNDAQFVSQSVPATMIAGQAYNITITMQNTGTTTWSTGAGYKLGSQNPQNNLIWGLNRVSLSSRQAISPGKKAVFTFNVTAPPTSGLYSFQWQMVREGKSKGGTTTTFFGQMSANLVVNVVGGSGGSDDAQFVSQNATTPIVAGATANVSVRMRNIGSTTWFAPDYKLGSQNPPLNAMWGLSSVALPVSVAPGSEVTFSFTITAPSTPGTYNFQWQMMKESSGFFGQITANFIINVTPSGGGGVNDAAFISQTRPDSAIAGQTFGITITMRNTGTTDWTSAGGHRLGSQNPQDNIVWGLNRVNLPASVAQDSNVTFLFNVIAPATPGTYNFQWRMLQEGVGYFGAPTDNVQITVTAAPAQDEEGYGNNLSIPAIFAEAHGITGLPTSQDNGLRPRPEEGILTLPYLDINYLYMLGDTVCYPQQSRSAWQAGVVNGDTTTGEQVTVNWSDNLLNTKWTPKQVIRVETVLYKNALPVMNAYAMEHLYGEGTSEMWGTTGATYDSTYKTVFSVNARLKIEKIDKPGGNVVPNVCGFNGAVYEKFGLDGSGGYGAEVNVSGSVIYGYNWMLNKCKAPNAQKLGWWRLTFTIDPQANYMIGGINFSIPRNTFLNALDAGDLVGAFFRPRLVSDSTTVLEIEITEKGGGKK